jgi:hypothetical protein
MIEFKGRYFQFPKAQPVAVLVQFDGVLLHVWHLPDPFYRLFTSDEFQIARSIGKAHHIIKLPNGGRVETDDTQTFKKLAIDYKNGTHITSDGLKSSWLLALLGSAAIILWAWWLAQNNIYF